MGVAGRGRATPVSGVGDEGYGLAVVVGVRVRVAVRIGVRVPVTTGLAG
jgi:hypothetical protein